MTDLGMIISKTFLEILELHFTSAMLRRMIGMEISLYHICSESDYRDSGLLHKN